MLPDNLPDTHQSSVAHRHQEAWDHSIMNHFVAHTQRPQHTVASMGKKHYHNHVGNCAQAIFWEQQS